MIDIRNKVRHFLDRYFWLVILVFLLGFVSACKESNQYVKPPPPAVTVEKPLKKDVTEYLEFTGTTDAFEHVEVRARVSGFLQSIHFEPGTQVAKDQLLFVIDPKPYEAELAAARAELASARVEFKRAQTELVRAEALFKKQYLSDTDRLKRQTERDTASAAIGRAEAKFKSAELNLGYTQVLAPISGRVSRNFVDVGNLVGEGDPTLLTTVTRYDPIYAYFHLNERDLLRVMAVHREEIKKKGLDPETDPGSKAEIPLYLGLSNEEGYPHRGVLDFAESDVSTETGTIEVRGIFPNPLKPPLLLPGLFTRLRFPVGEHPDALLVSERAVGSDQSGDFILVVNDQDIVEKKLIKPGQVIDGMRVIDSGLEVTDRVIINGLQRARPGSKVAPEEKRRVASTNSG